MTTIENTQRSDLQNFHNSSLTHQNDLAITTQPRTEGSELHSDDEDEKDRHRSRNDDCCCEPYYGPDECEFYLYGQCIGWFCVQLGKCMEIMFEGCSECITSCCDGGDTGAGCEDVDCCDCSCFND